MDSLLVVGWAALATLVNLGVGRWSRARDRRTPLPRVPEVAGRR